MVNEALITLLLRQLQNKK